MGVTMGATMGVPMPMGTTMRMPMVMTMGMSQTSKFYGKSFSGVFLHTPALLPSKQTAIVQM